MAPERALSRLVAIKRVADERAELASDQGKPLDGYSELANYRGVLARVEWDQMQVLYRAKAKRDRAARNREIDGSIYMSRLLDEPIRRR